MGSGFWGRTMKEARLPGRPVTKQLKSTPIPRGGCREGWDHKPGPQTCPAHSTGPGALGHQGSWSPRPTGAHPSLSMRPLSTLTSGGLAPQIQPAAGTALPSPGSSCKAELGAHLPSSHRTPQSTLVPYPGQPYTQKAVPHLALPAPTQGSCPCLLSLWSGSAPPSTPALPLPLMVAK